MLAAMVYQMRALKKILKLGEAGLQQSTEHTCKNRWMSGGCLLLVVLIKGTACWVCIFLLYFLVDGSNPVRNQALSTLVVIFAVGQLLLAGAYFAFAARVRTEIFLALKVIRNIGGPSDNGGAEISVAARTLTTTSTRLWLSSWMVLVGFGLTALIGIVLKNTLEGGVDQAKTRARYNIALGCCVQVPIFACLLLFGSPTRKGEVLVGRGMPMSNCSTVPLIASGHTGLL